MAMSNGITIRQAKIDDSSSIEEVRREVWLATYPNDELGITKADIQTKFKDLDTNIKKFKSLLMHDRCKKTWVAEVDKKVVGFLTLENSPEKKIIYAIYILSEYQRQGIGKEFIGVALEEFKDVEEILLRVSTYNKAAIGFYKKHSFKLVPEIPVDDFLLPSGKKIPVVWMINQMKSD